MRRQAGFTLVESLIAFGIAMVVITIVLSSVICTYHTFSSLTNYVQYNSQARIAMDKMSRDIRQAAALTNCTATSLAFTNTDGTLLSYQYNAGAQTLTYTNQGSNQGGILLKYCTACTFYAFLNSPVSGSCMLFTNTTSASGGKIIQVNWTCCLTNVSVTNSSMMESTRIVMRN